MAKLQYKSISRRTVEALSVAKDTVFWDNELTGFGVRVYPSGARVYVVQSRGPGGLKRVTVGRHGVISADQARLRDSKTGPRTVPLSPAAAKVLAGLPRGAGNPWVIAGRKPGVRLSNFNSHWYCVRKRAGLEDVRLHDLRHSFASRALALGESLTMIGKLLGHTKIQTTARYAHLARDSIKLSAARVAASIGADILPAGARTDAG